ncbi:MAG: hypothetical protein LAT55_02355 [Opitutales bacterium]|nr:hypothetical protein [Opitutales bacterium]
MKQISYSLLALLFGSAFYLKAESPTEVGGPAPITQACLKAAYEGWIEGLLKISAAHREGSDAVTVAGEVIDQGYNYGAGPVLFKPTLASGEDSFRTTREGALSYFVGGNEDFPHDSGFALKDWKDVEVSKKTYYIEGNVGLTMGHFTFIDGAGEHVKVEKTFGFRRDDSGDLRIVLHKSTLPYDPGSGE